jgi:hypothetical protein
MDSNTLAAILLTVATPLPPLLRRWAWLTWASGIALTLFTILDISRGVVIDSAALMTLFISFVMMLGARLR